VHLGRLLKFFQHYQRQLIVNMIVKDPIDVASSILWVITYSIVLAVDAVNVSFVMLLDRLLLLYKSLLFAQQEQHI
jgi:hypothetical protein